MQEKKLRLGEILVDAGVLKPEQLEAALALQKKRGIRLGQILLQERFISEPQLVQALSRRLSIPWVSLVYVDIADELLDLVPSHVAEEYFLIPVYIQSLDRKNRTLFVAMNDPTDETAIRFVSATAGMPVKPMVAGPSEISDAIQTYYYGHDDDDIEEVAPAGASTPPRPASIPVRAVSVPPRDIAAQTKPVVSKPPPPPTSKPPAEPASETPKAEPSESKDASPPPEADLLAAVVPESSDVSEETSPGEEGEGAALPDQFEEQRQQAQRELEKHMFGVGEKKRRRVTLTLLDGTQIDFGGASRKKDPSGEAFTKEDLVAGLRAAAMGTPMEDFLPSDKWEDYMAALLHVLFKKNLVFFDEIMTELKKKA